MSVRFLIAVAAIALIAISSEAQDINLEPEFVRLKKQGSLFVKVIRETGGSLPRQKDDFHCTTNLLHSTASSLPFAEFTARLMVLSNQMRDPRDKEAVYAALREHNERAIQEFERTKKYIDIAVQPCQTSDYVKSKALELHGLKGDTLVILKQLRDKLGTGK